MAGAIACTSARPSARTGMRRSSRSMLSAALVKAGCAVSGITMLPAPLGTPFCARAWARAARTARKMLSVPPLVISPADPSPPWNSDSPMAITSSSMRRTLVKARLPPSAFSVKKRMKASRPTS